MEGSKEPTLELIRLLCSSPKHKKKKNVFVDKPVTMQMLKEKIALTFQLPPEEKVIKMVDSYGVELETDLDCEFLESGNELTLTIEVTTRILALLNNLIERERSFSKRKYQYHQNIFQTFPF